MQFHFALVVLLVFSFSAVSAQTITTDVQPAQLTYYDQPGIGACGTQIDPSSQMLVAVSSAYWTTANPNDDPICQQCVQVSYNGVTLTLPIVDQCPSCASDHFDLSEPAFAKFADTSVGVIDGADAQFVPGPC